MAAAAEGDPQYLTVAKSVTEENLKPGDTFTYTIEATCSEKSCINATLSDVLPPELAGYPVNAFSATPQENVVPRTVAWTVGGQTSATPPAVLTADTSLLVSFNGATSNPVGAGLEFGTTFTVTLSLQVPENLPPGTHGPIVNTATTAADNSSPDADSAPVTVTVPKVIDVGVTKDWSPSPQTFEEGTPSTITLGVSNQSNLPADSLVIQEPQAASPGQTTLDPSNPFTITDLAGLTTTMPAGATEVLLEVYTKTGTTWGWQVASPKAATVTLPADLTTVGGFRLSYFGAIEPGASAAITAGVTQRAKQRDSGDDLSLATHAVDNVASATATADSTTSPVRTATASYTVNPVSVDVTTTKTISPKTISAGDSARAMISATNQSAVGVNELRMADLGYFTGAVEFGGFSESPMWPDNADSAQVIYHLASGGTSEVPFVEGEIPDAPADAVTGFEIVYTATDGGIRPGSGTAAFFAITTEEDATGGAVDLSTRNTVVSTVTAPNGKTATASDSDDLLVVKPSITVTLDKSIHPSAAVRPGQDVVTKLASSLVTSSDYVKATSIVVEDAWDASATGFWNAFNLASIAPTQVPGGASLTVSVQLADSSWVDIKVFPSTGQPFLAGLTTAELDTALTAAGTQRSAVQGVRFTFENATGFPASTSVTPYVVSTARETARTGGPTATDESEPVEYTNAATTTGNGVTSGGTVLSDTVEGSDDASVLPSRGDGVGITKKWLDATISSQSGLTSTTDLSWQVLPGFDTVTIADSAAAPSADPAAIAATVFEAFDLVAVEPIAASDETYSDSWYLTYDTITAVELFNGTAWVPVATVPQAGWVTNGAFAGYTLTEDERASTLAVRIVLAENTAARQAARVAGDAFDPYAPEPGSGVASSTNDRVFSLTWQLRNTARSDARFLTETTEINAEDAGRVKNTVGITGTTSTGPKSATASDEIQLTDVDPGVTVTKTTPRVAPLFAPVVPVDTDLTTQFTLTAKNNSTARASYVRVTDPSVCVNSATVATCQSAATAAGATGDPFGTGYDWTTPGGVDSPFRLLDITGLTIGASIADEVDLDASVVWLFRDGRTAADQITATEANALTAEDLADVVAVSVTFQGTDPATTGGTITAANDLTVVVDTTARGTYRDSGEAIVLPVPKTESTKNAVFAQSYDPVLNDPADVTALTGDVDSVDVVITSGVIDVVPRKSISPTTLPEPQRHSPVTVTLGATAPNLRDSKNSRNDDAHHRLSPREVWVRDDITSSPDFWDRFTFTGLGTLTASGGADRVKVALYVPGDDGELTWVEGPVSSFGMPILPVTDASRYADVQGVRLTYLREDGALFSQSAPAPMWSVSGTFTTTLRDTHRSDDDAPVTLDSVIDNTVTVQATQLGEGASSVQRITDADIDLNVGTHQIAVSKLANNGNRSVSPTSTVPWDLTFTNTGTGYLTVAELRDALPTELVYLGDPDPEFSTSAGGTLSDDVSIAEESRPGGGRDLVLTWPEEGRTMQPGETFTVRLWLELQPGLTGGQRATNTMTVTTDQTLTACTSPSTAGTTPAWSTDPTTCGTTDFVSPAPGANLYAVKGVRGSLPDAHTKNGDKVCAPTLNATGGSYFRSPCLADSLVGQTDSWALRVLNAGTVTVDELTFFDQLPTAGDKLLLSGQERESQFSPKIVDGSLAVTPVSVTGTLPTVTSSTIEATTSVGICQGTWSQVLIADPCTQNNETWFPAATVTDWSTVTGLRVKTTFAQPLAPGQGVDVTYRTTNVVATEADPSGVSASVPLTNAVAWNQFGVKYRNTGASTFSRIAPAEVGTRILTGPLEIVKEVSGDATRYAADSFLVDVVCTATGVTLDLGDQAEITLDAANGYTHRIDGIPVGAECSVTEQGDTGAFGETSRSGSVTGLSIDLAAATTDAVPAAQVVTLENVYDFTGLSVTKAVSTEATLGEFGPFDFTLACTSITGQTVVFDPTGDGIVESTDFTLEDGETYTAPAGIIPVGATCVVTEVDSSLADEIVIVGDNVTDNGDGSATVVPGSTPAEVTVTNGFGAGTLTVGKVVDGEGAALYGTGSFEFEATCTYLSQTLLEETFTLEGGSTRSFGTFPAGTECAVKETTTGGATDTVLDPADGVVTIAVQDTDETVSTATVTATNTYDLGTLELVKVVDGDGADVYGAGPFEAQVTCTWVKDGETLDIALANDGLVVLSEANGYAATITDLIVGAECAVVETATGGATLTATDPVDGVVTIPANDAGEQQSATVTLTNTFEVGSLTVDKKVVGPGAELYGAGPFTVGVLCVADVDGTPTEIALPDGGLLVLSDENGYTATIDGLLVGAECLVEEIQTGGATTSQTDPEDGVVTIPAQADGEPQSALVTVTNTFLVTSIDVTKVIQGNLDADGAKGAFTVDLVCTWDVDGVETAIDVPGGSTRELSAATRYVASYENLPVDATCSITETETGGAAGTAITVAVDGENGVPTTGTTATVALTGTTQAAKVVVTNAFDASPIVPNDVTKVTPGGDLASTGADSAWVVLAALALLLLGGAAVLVTRRTVRRS